MGVFIAFRISYSTWIVFCDPGMLWEICIDLKINVDFQKNKTSKKLQDVFITVLEQEIVKTIKEHCSCFKIVGLIIGSKIVQKLRFLWMTCFLCTKSKKFQEQMCQSFVLHIYTLFQKCNFNN